MADIIQLLPDAVANQIAAGEVIQRPASVVKELLENAIDAGSTDIKVNITDAGKTLIQIIDNGSGMSQTDARLAFERHATSKIKKAKDLFSIHTLGFRGEALASIAAISNVELKTRMHEEEIGTQLIIRGSELISQESISCPAGSNFSIKNLFFNVPARRKFLKSDTTEFQHIIREFQRIVFTQPTIGFQLIHNDLPVFNLPAEGIKQRIIRVQGARINKKLIAVNTSTDIIKISGFITVPEAAKKKYGEQFFFANQRFIRHPYLHKAVLQAYEKLIPPNYVPTYYIYLKVDPAALDVNIHPTKTEVKFAEEQVIYQILRASVKESLGKYSFVPSIDFEEDHSIKIPVAQKETSIKAPEISINPEYNPFNKPQKSDLGNWEKLYKTESFETTSPPVEPQTELHKKEPQPTGEKILQLKNQYILVQVKSGLLIIDQRRAHKQILYENFLDALQDKQSTSQKMLFSQNITFSPEDFVVVESLLDDLKKLGFEIETAAKSSINVKSKPSEIEIGELEYFFENLLGNYTQPEDFEKSQKEKLALSMAKVSAINYGRELNKAEMETIINQLFACQSHTFLPDGKKIIQILNVEELKKMFK